MVFWSRSRFTRVRPTRSARAPDTVPGVLVVGLQRLSCRIRGAAQAGAIIEIEARDIPALPEHFFLKLESDRTHRRVRLIWQHRRQAGVEFVTPWSVRR